MYDGFPHLLQHICLFNSLQYNLFRCLLSFPTQYKLVQDVVRFLKVEDDVQLAYLVEGGRQRYTDTWETESTSWRLHCERDSHCQNTCPAVQRICGWSRGLSVRSLGLLQHSKNTDWHICKWNKVKYALTYSFWWPLYYKHHVLTRTTRHNPVYLMSRFNRHFDPFNRFHQIHILCFFVWQ